MSQNLTITAGAYELRQTDSGWKVEIDAGNSEAGASSDVEALNDRLKDSAMSDLLESLAKELLKASNRETELVDMLQHIRGNSSCWDVWDEIDEVIPYNDALYS